MASLLLTSLLLLLLPLSSPAFAQQQQITWSSVIYTYHGERVPILAAGPYQLTPLGANQLVNAGSIIRNRYISPPVNGTQITTAAPINGISVDAIDNTQLYIQSIDDVVVSSSAIAFMQGLYPPGDGGQDILGNSSTESFPLGGYQYPMITTVSGLDFNYIWIASNLGCPEWDIATVETLSSSAYQAEMASTTNFYNSLANSVFGAFDIDLINYANAADLYEYALYEYNHNQTVYKTLSPDDLAHLFNLASQQQFELNSPNRQGTISSITGQTLASKVIQQFSHSIGSFGAADKLTLLFGSFEPILAFFALSNLSVSPSSSQFTSLPSHGSSLVFELFSYTNVSDSASSSADGTLSTPFPLPEELWVRFLFRNGTDETAPLLSHPLFGRGNSETDMSWADFITGMATFSLDDITDWCVTCEAATLFCQAIEDDISNAKNPGSSSSSPKKSLSPVIAGVIGAVVTIVTLILLGLALTLIGLRLNFHDRRGKAPQLGDIHVLSKNGNGGFKGAEKLASDTDLTLKGGAGATVVRHERVGSWELNEGLDGKHRSLDKEINGGVKRVVSGADYGRRSEDGLEHVNPFGDPVKPADQV